MNVSMATALLADTAAMERFLAPIPNSDRLATILDQGEPLSSRAYDDDAWTARFVASDGVSVKCFTVTDVTIDQAEMIASECSDFSGWEEADFRHMVQRVLAPTPDLPP